ncbi:hypothetical protein GCM10010363_00260 [Streptomyces omiyaensis]|nr:hypothetical protein GCM10010363_00260 [Streptomyces omiyaensis]
MTWTSDPERIGGSSLHANAEGGAPRKGGAALGAFRHGAPRTAPRAVPFRLRVRFRFRVRLRLRLRLRFRSGSAWMWPAVAGGPRVPVAQTTGRTRASAGGSPVRRAWATRALTSASVRGR